VLTKWLNQMGNNRDIDTTTRILAAARKVFLKKGMAGARMQEIADEAGINKALLHYYFRSKDQLFRVVFEQAIGEMIPQLQTVLAQELPIREKLRAFIRVYLEQLQAHPVVPLFVLNELNRGAESLVDIFRTHLLVDIPSGQKMPPQLLVEQIQAAQLRGELPPYPADHLLVNILSMCIFPFLARPMLQFLLQLDDAAFEAFIEERINQVQLFIDRALRGA